MPQNVVAVWPHHAAALIHSHRFCVELPGQNSNFKSPGKASLVNELAHQRGSDSAAPVFG